VRGAGCPFAISWLFLRSGIRVPHAVLAADAVAVLPRCRPCLACCCPASCRLCFAEWPLRCWSGSHLVTVALLCALPSLAAEFCLCSYCGFPKLLPRWAALCVCLRAVAAVASATSYSLARLATVGIWMAFVRRVCFAVLRFSRKRRVLTELAAQTCLRSLRLHGNHCALQR